MNLQKSFIKKIAFMLIISVLSLNLTFLAVPKTTNAYGLVWDPALGVQTNMLILLDKGAQLLERALAALVKIAALKLIAMVMQSTADWIKGGFNGNPAYISDVNKFLGGTGGVADQTVGQWFANQGNLSFLCAPFKIQVALALQFQYGSAAQNMNCTFTQVANNVVNAVDNATLTVDVNGNPITVNQNNFTNEGGWDAWLKTTLQPQNNPIGAYMIGKAKIDAAVIDAKGNKVADLNFGSGALSFKRCKDVYYDASGKEIWTSPDYTENSQNPPDFPFSHKSGDRFEGYSKFNHKCDMRTPGSVISGWAFQKASSDVRQSEYVTAFANGLDQIFSALVSVIMQKALSQLNKGVLNADVADTNAYLSNLDTMQANTLNNYNSDLANLNNEQGQIDWTNPDSFPTSTSITTIPLIIGTTTWNYDPTLPPSWNYNLLSTSTNEVNITPIGGYGGALDQAKNNATILLNSLAKSEANYQNNYTVAKNILTQADAIFATSSACNMSYNRNDTILRSLLIRSNIITNIEGSYSSDRSLAPIPWNLPTINNALKNSSINVALLSATASAVSGAPSLQVINDAMIPVNSTSFNTDPQYNMIANIKTWLRGVQGMYNTPLCPIDLTSVLQLTSF